MARQGSPPYAVCFQSVDGAGRYAERFESRADAVAFADERAAISNSTLIADILNPWSYRYRVVDRWGSVIYRPAFERARIATRAERRAIADRHYHELAGRNHV